MRRPLSQAVFHGATWVVLPLVGDAPTIGLMSGETVFDGLMSDLGGNGANGKNGHQAPGEELPTEEDFRTAGLPDPSDYIPPECDLLWFDGAKLKKIVDSGKDARIHSIQLLRVEQGGRGVSLGIFPIAGACQANLKARFGPGIYDCKGRNANGEYIVGRRITIQSDNPYAGPQPQGFTNSWSAASNPYPVGAPGFGGPPMGSAPMGAQSPLEAIALDLLRQKLTSAQDDPLRGALAEMMKMTMLGLEQTRQAMSTIATVQTQNQQPTFELLKLFLPMLNQKPAKSGGGGSMAEALEMFKLGLGLAQMKNPEEDKEEGGFAKMVAAIAPIVDSLGPGLVTLMAQAALPADRADAVKQAIEAHMKAREAEARADSVVDTTGREVA